MLTNEEKKWRIERAQEDAKADLKVIKRDFFDDLPRSVCDILDMISWRWKKYSWFEEAWNKYREHVLDVTENGGKIKAPGFVFNSYIDEQVKEDFLNEDQLSVLHSDCDIKELCHTQYRKRKGTTGGGQFTNENDPEGEPIPGTESQVKVEVVNKQPNINPNQNKKDSDPGKVFKESKTMLDSLAQMIATERKGSKLVVNRAKYADMPDEELRKRVNRMTLERQYGDLTGDNKYVMTGREKARELIQTLGAAVGIIGSMVTIGYTIHKVKNS